jgi:hypothetical protein
MVMIDVKTITVAEVPAGQGFGIYRQEDSPYPVVEGPYLKINPKEHRGVTVNAEIPTGAVNLSGDDSSFVFFPESQPVLLVCPPKEVR